MSVGTFISGWYWISLLFRYYFTSDLFLLMILSWYTLILQRANSSDKTLHNSLYFNLKNMDLSSWVMLLLIKILYAAALDLFSEWVSLKKVSISPPFTAINPPKYFKKFVIMSIVCWVETPRVFLKKSVDTSRSYNVTVDKTWCKLMLRLLLLFHLKRCTLVTSIILAIV